MARLVVLAAALSAQHVLATNSCPSSDPTCSGDADEAALLQRAVSQHVQNVSRGSCSVTPAATCGNPSINCYWDQECNDNGGTCCNAGGAGMACKYCGDSGSSGCNQPCCETGLPDSCTNPKGPPCPPNSHCHPGSGRCVCTADHCVRNGNCVAMTTTTTTTAPSCETGLNDRCTNSKGPPCPLGSSCQHATGYCVCNMGSCANSLRDACGPVCDADLDQSCANARGPPCPPGTHCHPASKMCVCDY